MATYIHSIAAGAPETAYGQTFIAQFMEQAITASGGDEAAARYLRRIYAHSGIETRHSVIRDFVPRAAEFFFKRNPDGSYAAPGTGARNDLFIRESRKLYADLARAAIAKCPGLSPDGIADGGAAAIVSAADPAPGHAVFEIHDFESALVPGTEGDMAWRIGDLGFDIVLSSYVPQIIDRNIERVLASLFRSRRLGLDEVGTWAIHPGGRAIVDKLEKSLALDPAQVRPSRKVLRRYGNMSSPTVLFVLDEILRAPSARGRETVCALAFGPGLTMETALLETRASFAAPAEKCGLSLGTHQG